MSLISLIGFGATIVTVVAPLPQVVHTLQTREVSSFSVPSSIVSCCCTCLWLLYGLCLRDVPIIACNIIMLGLQVVLARTIISIRSARHRGAVGEAGDALVASAA
jgi:MtN3 and saliva related transmembrane protein